METLVREQILEPRAFTAINYAFDSENVMHSNEGARKFGFRGGLVPGIGDYAYFVPTVLDALGDDWAITGWIAVKFLRPIFDGDRVEVTGEVVSVEPLELSLELRSVDDELCAVATAGIEAGDQWEEGVLPWASLPAAEARPKASLEVLAAGTLLGTLQVRLEEAALRETWREHFGVAGELPAGLNAPHPAFYPDLGNRVLTQNVVLGPWIHTESRSLHVEAPRWGEEISVRSRVREAFSKRGHEIVYLDVGFFGDDDRTLARLDHRAIIRPRATDRS